MNKIIICVLIVLGIYYWNTNPKSNEISGMYGERHNEVIMYSLTTCGYCQAKAKELHSEGIEFIEYYIDTDQSRREELNDKLAKAGFPPQSYGTPILDVHGVMLPHNPSMSLIKKQLENSDS